MGGCDRKALKGMDKDEYGTHIHNLAVELKDLVAEKAAETVHQDAETMQFNAQELANHEEEVEAHEQGRRPSLPAPKGADHGYRFFKGSPAQEIIDDYKNNYQINLLTFNSSDKEDAKRRLADEELTYIVDKFDRAQEFADPNDEGYETVISALTNVAGDDELADIEFRPDSNDAVTVHETANSGQGKFGDASFSHIGGIMDSTQDGFDSATGQTFSKQFLPRVPVAADNQKGAARTLRNLVVTNQEVLTWARADLDSLVHDAIDTVEHFDDCKNGDDSASTALGLIGGTAVIIAGIASIPVSGGLSASAVAAGGTIVAGSMATVRTLHDAEATEQPFEGSDLDEIVKDIMDKVDGTLERYDNITEALENDGFSRVANCISSGKYAEGGAADEFEGSKANFAAPVPNDGFMDAEQGDVRETVDDEG